ncbi:hypothetical protein RUM43_003701 [Polyplax serrata]|uniref:Aminopeptidase N-like N-terminal domain-containing protein n=1 Tax=Polyplax serrata TaxID=468196 RepID=A0AAN8NX77_POLSC
MSVGVVLFVCLVAFATTEVESLSPSWEKNNLIPKEIRPLSYDILVDPDLDEGTFKGEVTIEFNLTATRDEWLPVHIKNLNITQTIMTDNKGNEVNIKETFEYPKNNFWVMKTDVIQPDLYKLHMKFHGSLVQSLVGFYRSVYHENGTNR